MLVGDVDKQPSEIKRYAWDYSSWLGDGETIVHEGEVLVTITADSDELTIDPDDIEVAEGNKSVACLVSGGEDGGEYVVTIKVRTNLGQLKEDEIIVRVNELNGT